MSAVRRFLGDEQGATAIEYGLIALLVSVGIVASVVAFGNSFGNLFTYIANHIVRCDGSLRLSASFPARP